MADSTATLEKTSAKTTKKSAKPARIQHHDQRKIVRHVSKNTVLMPDTHPVIASVYRHRGIDDARLLDRNLNQLMPLDGLKDVDRAACLLYEAIVENQTIVIMGDFDADGATSTAVATLGLRAMGAKKIHHVVPDRFKFGYGLTPELVNFAMPLKPDLLVTVDNGISSVAGVDHAKSLGLKVLITDHHLAPERLPNADAIVNPNQPGDTFPSKNLAGVGVIFYVLLALRSFMRAQGAFDEKPAPNLAELLDLVAIGTIADVVPLDRNNRLLIHHGLKRIRAQKTRPGVRALLQVAKKDLLYLSATDVAFGVAPRLNAAGRLEDMSIGIACLLSDSPNEAANLAKTLDKLNEERKALEADMESMAYEIVESLSLDENNLPSILCLYDQSWHQGVVGLVAARVKERYQRPVIAFAKSSDDSIVLKGSARSVEGLHIRDLLADFDRLHPNIMHKYGGHAMAAGLSLDQEQFADFAEKLAPITQKATEKLDLEAVIYSDGALTSKEFNLNFANKLWQAGPFGQAFPEPIFDNVFEIESQTLMGTHHMRLDLVEPKSGRQVSAVAFFIDTESWRHDALVARFAYKLQINHFRGRQKVQLLIEAVDWDATH